MMRIVFVTHRVRYCILGSLTNLLIGILFLTFKGGGFFLNAEQRHWARPFPLQKLIALESWSKMMGNQQKLCAKVRDAAEELRSLGLGKKYMIRYFLTFLFCHLLKQWLLEHCNSWVNCSCHSSWNYIFCHSFSYLDLNHYQLKQFTKHGEFKHAKSRSQNFGSFSSFRVARALLWLSTYIVTLACHLQQDRDRSSVPLPWWQGTSFCSLASLSWAAHNLQHSVAPGQCRNICWVQSCM